MYVAKQAAAGIPGLTTSLSLYSAAVSQHPLYLLYTTMKDIIESQGRALLLDG